ncbi:MFS transporter [Sphaerisporangium album]|uniref:MFS transporter n=1 Tax=Sphaerisporangium album TaxID=509200 RepID=A0A367FA98_9ACTN|nr:MFS transporter [Sphaerisporangium album]RCG27278.1 MFS transporter [Sphaerisporangium album]
MSFLKDVIPPAGIVRLLAISNLAKTTAHGILMTISVLYFTRVIGIAPERVGLALTLGAAVGMLSSVPAGRLADVRGPRAVTITMLALLGVAACGYALVSGFVGLVVAAAVVLGFESASHAARGALLAGLLPGAARSHALAHMRSTANIGVALGSVAGGLGLLFDSRAGYMGLLITAGVLYTTAGLAFLRVPSVPATGAGPKEGPSWGVLRDLPYAAVSLVNSVLVMSDAVLVVAMPVWISQQTTAPPFFLTVMLLVNTAVVILFQVRASKGSEDVTGGVRAWRRASLALAACCAIFAASAGQPVWVACALLLVGTLVHVFGEMLHSAGAWSLSYGLAPEGAQGQYQGLFEMSTQLGSMIAPVAVTTVLAAIGGMGLLVWAGVFLVAGMIAAPIARWAQRTRIGPVEASVTAADA